MRANPQDTRLHALMLKVLWRKLQAWQPNPWLRLAVLAAVAVFAAAVGFYGLYLPINSLFGMVGTEQSSEIQIAVLLIAVFGLGAIALSVMASYPAVPGPPESVAALPVRAAAWRGVAARIYAGSALLVSLPVNVAITVATLHQGRLGSLAAGRLLAFVMAVLLLQFLLLDLVVLMLQAAGSRVRLILSCLPAAAIIVGAVVLHRFSLDKPLITQISHIILSGSAVDGFKALALGSAIAAGLWLARRQAANGMWNQSLKVEILAARLRRHPPGIVKALPALSRITLLAMLRDWRSSLWVMASLALLAALTLLAAHYRNPSVSAFVVFFSPMALALIASNWLSRLRAYLGPSGLAVYALPVRPVQLIVQQGLALPAAAATVISVLVTAQAALLTRVPAPGQIFGLWSALCAACMAFYVVSQIFAGNARNFSLNSVLEISCLLTSFLIMGPFEHLRDKQAPAALIAGIMLGCSLAILLVAYLTEKHSLQGAQ